MNIHGEKFNEKICSECGNWVRSSSLVSTQGKLSYHSECCRDCYHELESDEE